MKFSDRYKMKAWPFWFAAVAMLLVSIFIVKTPTEAEVSPDARYIVYHVQGCFMILFFALNLALRKQ
jgi:Na+/melibiose symporter-like transporter